MSEFPETETGEVPASELPASRVLVGLSDGLEETHRSAEMGPYIAVGISFDHGDEPTLLATTLDLTVTAVAVRRAQGWEVCGLPGEYWAEASFYTRPADGGGKLSDSM